MKGAIMHGNVVCVCARARVCVVTTVILTHSYWSIRNVVTPF
jgi:hypothetical protein